MKRKTIQVSEENYQFLLGWKSEMMEVHGIHFSFDDVIADILSIIEEPSMLRAIADETVTATREDLKV